MSVVVDEFPAHPKQKYDWSQWADGRIHKLQRGVDFTTTARVFKQAARGHAKHHGLALKLAADGGANFVWLQFTPVQTLRSVG